MSLCPEKEILLMKAVKALQPTKIKKVFKKSRRRWRSWCPRWKPCNRTLFEVLKSIRLFADVAKFCVLYSTVLYHMSRMAESMDEFWSHSWHASAWKKILTLLFLKNALPAAILGSFASLIGCSLSFFEILPSFGSVPLWSNFCGVVVYLATLLLWRSRETVFLDIGCIHQSDERLKSELCHNKF